MKAALCVLVVAFALAVADDTEKSAAASPTKYSPQEKFLAQDAYGNFACHVNSIKVTTENPGDAEEPFVSAQNIRDAFEQVASLEWAHVLQASFSSLDGRNEEKVLATPGGDMGEFIQALQAFSKITGKDLSADDVLRFFERYLRVMSREKFSYETDEKAYIRLAVATGCRNLHVADMGGMKRKKEDYLAKITFPEHIGDPFIRFLSANATELDMNIALIHHALAAYHRVLWTAPSKLASKLCYLEMKGSPRREAALVHIRTDPYCVDQGLAPMISQQLACPAPVFVNHPDAVRLLRRELVSVMTDSDDVREQAREVLATFNQIAETNLEKFWGEVGAGLPVYTVEFSNSSPLFSKEAEFKPDDEQ